MSSERRQSGLTLIELIVFIIVVSVGLAGVLSIFSVTVRNSADPLANKQAIAIAEAVMEEVALKPFTFCDAADANVLTAVSPAGCATLSMDLPANWGAGNCRVANCDHVAKYNGFAMSPPTDVLGSSNAALAGYSVTVAVSQLPAARFALADANDALQISVRVQRGATDVSLTGFRLRHSPNWPG